MRKWTLSIAAFLAIAGVAFAAENPVMATGQEGWTGPYAGMQVGYLWGHGDNTLCNLPENS